MTSNKYFTEFFSEGRWVIVQDYASSLEDACEIASIVLERGHQARIVVAV